MTAENTQPTPIEQPELNQAQKPDLSEMAHLVRVSEGGNTAHRPDGKFVSNSELEQIKSHEKQIEAGLKGRIDDLVRMDTLNRARRSNGKMMSKDEIRQIADHQDQIRDGLSGRGTPLDFEQVVGLENPEQEVLESTIEPIESVEPADFIEADEPGYVEVDVTPQTLSEKVNRIFTKAGLKLQALAVKAREYYSDEEKGKERQVVAVAVGALAFAAVAGAAYYLGKQGHDTSALQNFSLDHKPELDTSVHAIPSFPEVEVIQPEIAVAPEAAPVSLVLESSGDTVWDTVKEYADNNGVSMSNAQIQEQVSKILADNNQTWETARTMPIGTSFTLSPERIEEIMKLKS